VKDNSVHRFSFLTCAAEMAQLENAAQRDWWNKLRHKIYGISFFRTNTTSPDDRSLAAVYRCIL